MVKLAAVTINSFRNAAELSWAGPSIFQGDKQDRKLTRVDKLGLLYHNDSLSRLALGVLSRGFFRGLLRGATG